MSSSSETDPSMNLSEDPNDVEVEIIKPTPRQVNVISDDEIEENNNQGMNEALVREMAGLVY